MDRQQARFLALGLAVLCGASASCSNRGQRVAVGQAPEAHGETVAVGGKARTVVVDLGGWKACAKTKNELPSRGWGRARWKWMSHNGIEIGLATDELPTDSEPCVDCYGYVYNVRFKEWRRFMALNLRHVVDPVYELDRRRGIIRIVERGNTTLQGKTVFEQSVRTLSNDQAFSQLQR